MIAELYQDSESDIQKPPNTDKLTILKYLSEKKPKVKFGQLWWYMPFPQPSGGIGGWISVVLRPTWSNIEKPGLIKKKQANKKAEI